MDISDFIIILDKSVKRTASAPGEEEIYEGIPEIEPPAPPAYVH